ncbi:MAG: Lrp/AsnC ligand binding domain-containing protein [Actinomycetota bacterium]
MDAYVLLRTEPGTTREAADRLTGLAGQGIRQVMVISGEWDVLVALDVADPHELGRVVMDQVLAGGEVLESHTAVVVPSIEAGRPKPVPKPTPRPRPMPVRARSPFTAVVFAGLDSEAGRTSDEGWHAWLGDVTDALEATPGVLASAVVTGEYDLIVEVGGQTWEECAQGILGVAAVSGLTSTSTAVAVTPKLVPVAASA